jgi:hypothetical protein
MNGSNVHPPDAKTEGGWNMATQNDTPAVNPAEIPVYFSKPQNFFGVVRFAMISIAWIVSARRHFFEFSRKETLARTHAGEAMTRNIDACIVSLRSRGTLHRR